MTRRLRTLPIWATVAMAPTALFAADAPRAKWLAAPQSEAAEPVATQVVLDPTMITAAYALLALAAALLLLGRLAQVLSRRGYALPRLMPVRLRHRDDPFARLSEEAHRR